MKMFLKIIAGLLAGLVLVILLGLLLMAADVIWRSPPYYSVANRQALTVPVMNMTDYWEIINSHRRPYIYKINSKSGGVVHIVGIEHTKDPQHPQIDSLRTVWKAAKPDVLLVEGRLGFYFSWFMDPIEHYGESGLAVHLAKRAGVELYTWEPTRQDEVEMLLPKYTPQQLAMFYSFRPYFSKMRFGKPADPEAKLQEYLDDRTDYPHIRGVFSSWQELDSLWQEMHPDIEWRNYSDGIGWPEGFLKDLANDSNLARDEHMIQIILELLEQGKTVLVTMGSSHAPRIEAALQTAIKE